MKLMTKIDIKNYLSDAVKNDVTIYDPDRPGCISNKLIANILDYAESNNDEVVEWIMPRDSKYLTVMTISHVKYDGPTNMLGVPKSVSILDIPAHFTPFLNEDCEINKYFEDNFRLGFVHHTNQIMIAKLKNKGYILGNF